MRSMRKLAGWMAASVMLALVFVLPVTADPPLPDPGSLSPLSSEIEHLHFRYGPIAIAPGQNLILVGPVTIEKPAYDGYVVGFRPNLVRADGNVPPIEQIHLHHAVWLNLTGRDTTSSGVPGQRFAAAGEEKTHFALPLGYGYPVHSSDVWALNYMVHNETPNPDQVWITYDVDYVPANSSLAHRLVPVRPLWMDVQNGENYPVFDVHRGSGSRGRFTYPDQAPSAPRRNTWTVDRPGSLIWAAGHLHPGGLWTDLRVTRQRRSKLIFRSRAKYWDPLGPVSWDMAMTATPPRWRVALRKGDSLSINATYETRQASWYESMGIMIAWLAPPSGRAVDPFAHPAAIPLSGRVTHGHLPEADNHGGGPTGLPDPASLPGGQTLNNEIGVSAFRYLPGDLTLAGTFKDPPVFHPGQPIQFGNADASAQIFHTITACRSPCTGATGISYPLANGSMEFDSGELGYGPSGTTAARNDAYWTLSRRLTPGTYTYFCRVHPFMRGAFRIAK